MLTGKERAQYRKEANGLETIMQIGKGGLEAASIKQIDDALTARGLIKIRVLETCEFTARDMAAAAAQATNSECIQVIGAKFVLWREKPEKPIAVPTAKPVVKSTQKAKQAFAKFNGRPGQKKTTARKQLNRNAR